MKSIQDDAADRISTEIPDIQELIIQAIAVLSIDNPDPALKKIRYVASIIAERDTSKNEKRAATFPVLEK